MKHKAWMLGLASLAIAGTVQAATIYSEGFDNLAASGWTLTNNSTPMGTSWYQGNAGVFEAQAGAADAYASANFLSAGSDSGAISNWLISPEITLSGASELQFYLRSGSDSGFTDQVNVYFSEGSASGTASFTTLLGSITASTSGWTQYTLSLPSAVTGRIAFEYAVSNAMSANVVGVDSVMLGTSAVPEASTYLMLSLGLAGLALVRRRAAAR